MDECISLYGKFRAARRIRPDMSCEMFIDITPGTPQIYRKEMFTKLLLIGYELENNMLYGSDMRVQNYKPDQLKEKVLRDGFIYKELGISEETKELIYGKNLLRFVGVNK